jgi:hypothetical protein
MGKGTDYTDAMKCNLQVLMVYHNPLTLLGIRVKSAVVIKNELRG